MPEIVELDLNPVIALPAGHGCRIVDARIKVGRTAQAVSVTPGSRPRGPAEGPPGGFTQTIGRRQTDRTSAASLPACPAYADVSEKIVSRKPLGSLTSNARLFHSVS